MKIDSREFSQQAYRSLYKLKRNLTQLAEDVLKEEKKERRSSTPPTEDEIAKRALSYYEKSSSLVQGLAVYISTWGLHRLTGDAKKFSIGTASDTQYKGRVYALFLEHLKEFSQEKFVLWSEGGNAEDERSLVNMSLQKYTSLNRLAMQLAREWSFWATSILEEDKAKLEEEAKTQ